MRTYLGLAGWALALAAASGAASSAKAALIEFTFTGVVEELTFGTPTGDWSDVAIGTPWTLTYVFDSETPDIDNSPWNGEYRDIGPMTFEAGGGVLCYESVAIRIERLGVDRYFLDASTQPEGGLGLTLVPLSPFVDDQLPTELDLDDFGLTRLGVTILGDEPFTFRSFNMLFSQQIVPGPSGLPLLLCIFGRRRRDRCQIGWYGHASGGWGRAKRAASGVRARMR